jgi:hypothetical protein
MPETDVIAFADVRFSPTGAVRPPNVLDFAHTQHGFAYPLLWNHVGFKEKKFESHPPASAQH